MGHSRDVRLAALSLIAIASGCGGADVPPLGNVTGQVTVNGELLTGAIVVFSPESGRPAVGITNESGEYEIQYVEGVEGCKVGPNDVMFAVPTGGSVSPSIPMRYQSKSELHVDVKAGDNRFDFHLQDEENEVKPAPAKPGIVID